MQTNRAVEQNKNIKRSESPWNQSGPKGKGLWRNHFAITGKRHMLVLYSLIGNRIQPFDWYHNQWSWMKFKGVATADACYLCGSWAFCLFRALAVLDGLKSVERGGSWNTKAIPQWHFCFL